MKEYSIREKLDLVEGLTKSFYITQDVNNMPGFEEGLAKIRLFEDEYLLVHEELRLYFDVVTGRYVPFKISELSILPLLEGSRAHITRRSVIVRSQDLLYANSYGRFLTETTIYLPVLFQLSIRHARKNAPKRQVLDVINILNNNKEVLEKFRQERYTDHEDLMEVIGVNTLKKLYSAQGEDKKVLLDLLQANISTWGEAIDLIMQGLELNYDSYIYVQNLLNFSRNTTKRLLEKTEFKSLF